MRKADREAALLAALVLTWAGVLFQQWRLPQVPDEPVSTGGVSAGHPPAPLPEPGSAEEARLIGQVFMTEKVSELLMPRKVREALQVDVRQLKRERPVSGRAVELLSVQVTDEERAARELRPETTAATAERLRGHGVVALPALLDRAACRSVAEAAVAYIRDPQADFGTISQRKFRKDMPLPLEGAPFELVRDVVRLLGPALRENLGDAIVIEYSTLTSFPGAARQDFHSDASGESLQEMLDSAKLYSVFVYLDDVAPETAPLDVVPGTHTHWHFLHVDERQMLTSAPYVRMAVPQGSVVIFDSWLQHRGAPNTSNLTRPTLYLSLLEPNKPIPEGSTFTIRSEYKGLRLSQIEAGEVPAAVVSEQIAAHDDATCLASIRAAGCTGWGDALHECAVDATRRPSKSNSAPTEAEQAETCEADNSLNNTDEDEDVEDEDEDDEDDEDEDEEDFEDAVNHFNDDRWHELDAVLPGCALASRLERVCKAGIHAEGFVAQATWGPLHS